MRNLVKEAIVEAVGIRCPDHDADCLTCQTWGQFEALEAAQAQAAKVRRETIEECAKIAVERTKDRQTLYSDNRKEPREIKAIEAGYVAAAIRALTDAAKGDQA